MEIHWWRIQCVTCSFRIYTNLNAVIISLLTRDDIAWYVCYWLWTDEYRLQTITYTARDLIPHIVLYSHSPNPCDHVRALAALASSDSHMMWSHGIHRHRLPRRTKTNDWWIWWWISYNCHRYHTTSTEDLTFGKTGLNKNHWMPVALQSCNHTKTQRKLKVLLLQMY